MSIFRGNDIRGVYGLDLTDEKATRIGGAFVQFLKCKEVVVGRDARLSSPRLAKALIKGLRDAGARVIDIGIIDSPGLYFASHFLKKPAIMVTASHNPSGDNGFYLCKSDAQPIYKENGLRTIEELAEKPFKTTRGSYSTYSIWPAYERHVLSFVKRSVLAPLKVVVDIGNGVGGVIAQRVFSKLPHLTVVSINTKPDGRFPNRGPDTSEPKNLAMLVKRVKQERAAIGLAFDGDADRVAFVDERGSIIEGSLTGALLVSHLLSKKKETVVYSIRCSQVVPELITRKQGVALRERVGHSFIATRMREQRALFGIENTGHYFYRNNFYTESAIITSLLVLSILSRSGTSLSELVKPFRKYAMTPEFSISSRNPVRALPRIEKALREHYKRRVDTFDGLLVTCGSYWLSVRASQTESKIRMVVEATTRAQALQKQRELVQLVRRVLKET